MIRRPRNEKLNTAVGERLRTLRLERGLSQEKVYFQTNIHLSNIENGRRDMTFVTLLELCDTYNITIREFFDGLDDEKFRAQ